MFHVQWSMSPSMSSNNRLLTALPEIVYQRLEPYFTFVSLPVGEICYEALEKIDTVYFPNTALISLVSTLSDGFTSEISLVGSTGMIGLPVILGSGYSQHRAFIQVSGSIVKISASILKNEFDTGGELQKLLLAYVEDRLNEVAQLSICNRHHNIEERMARWLLMVQDFVQSDELPLTQEFIGQMLGVNRPGVTLTAGAFQRSGLIRYTRGKISILNRNALEDVACECYQLFHKHFYQQ